MHPQDILTNPPLAAPLFWVPIFAIVLTYYLGIRTDLRTAVWTVSCLTMAVSSVINAMRCGRRQSLLLTPLFLAGAVASLFYGSGLIPLGPAGWAEIGAVLFVGLLLIGSVPELLLGRYR